MRPITPEQVARFWSRVDKSGDCWLWTGCQNGLGYGQLRVWNINRLAHRFAYEHTVGSIPEGLHLDHLCRVRSCVNPEHLEPVTQAENSRRVPPRTHCPKGHEYTPDNVYFLKKAPNSAVCRTCHRNRERIRKQRRRAIDGPAWWKLPRTTADDGQSWS